MTDKFDKPAKAASKKRSSAVATGAATLLASGIYRQGLGLLTLIVTARLLTPEHFGIIAYFMIATTFLEMLQRQIVISLIRMETITTDHLHTVFTVQVILSAIAALLIWVLMSAVFAIGLSELEPLGPSLALFALILAIRSPRFVLFERELKFFQAAIEETLFRTVYSIFAITLAWLWQDFWAIVIATLLAQCVRSGWTFRVAPMTLRLTLVQWRGSIAFSTWAMAAQIVQFFSKNLPQIIIGSMLGLAEAGLFRLGKRIAELATTGFFAPMQRVLFPGLADVSRNSDRQQEAFMKMNAAMLTIVLPISIGTALLAEDIIVLAMGPKWILAAQVIWVLAPLKALETLQANVRAAIYVDGSTHVLFFRNLLLLALTALFMWIGVNFGFSGAILSAAASSLAAVFMTLVLARKFASGGFMAPIWAGWRGFAASGVMIAAVLAIEVMSPIVDAAPLLLLVITKIIAGILAYLSALLAFWVLSGKPEGLEQLLLAAVKIPTRS